MSLMEDGATVNVNKERRQEPAVTMSATSAKRLVSRGRSGQVRDPGPDRQK